MTTVLRAAAGLFTAGMILSAFRLKPAVIKSPIKFIPYKLVRVLDPSTTEPVASSSTMATTSSTKASYSQYVYQMPKPHYKPYYKPYKPPNPCYPSNGYQTTPGSNCNPKTSNYYCNEMTTTSMPTTAAPTAIKPQINNNYHYHTHYIKDYVKMYPKTYAPALTEPMPTTPSTSTMSSTPESIPMMSSSTPMYTYGVTLNYQKILQHLGIIDKYSIRLDATPAPIENYAPIKARPNHIYSPLYATDVAFTLLKENL